MRHWYPLQTCLFRRPAFVLSHRYYGPFDHRSQSFGCTSISSQRGRRAGMSLEPPSQFMQDSQWRPSCSQTEQSLAEHKQQSKLIFRRITPNSEPRCSIESGAYTLQCVPFIGVRDMADHLVSKPPVTS